MHRNIAEIGQALFEERKDVRTAKEQHAATKKGTECMLYARDIGAWIVPNDADFLDLCPWGEEEDDEDRCSGKDDCRISQRKYEPLQRPNSSLKTAERAQPPSPRVAASPLMALGDEAS